MVDWGDDKLRFTAMLYGAADGSMGPPFIIVKCASAKSDLSKTRVLQELHLQPGFLASEGWELRMWTKPFVGTLRSY